MPPTQHKLLEILGSLEQAEKDLLKQQRIQEKATVSYRVGFWVFWAGFMAPMVCSMAVALAVWLGVAPRNWLVASVILLLLTYLVILTYPLLGAWLYRGAILSVFRAPFANLLNNYLERPLRVDGDYLPQLAVLPKPELQLGIMELKEARKSLAQRVALVAGPIETVGILPGLVAMLVTFQQLDSQPAWIQAIAYANPLIFVMAVIGHNFLARYDRMIALAELALTQQPEIAQATPNAPRLVAQ